MGWIGGLFDLVGGSVKGYFNLKQAQVDVVSNALSTLSNLAATDAQRASALATLYAADSQSESWLTRSWRPLLIFAMLGMLISYFWFGYTPPHFNEPLSPMMDHLLTVFETLIGVNIAGRSVEKAVGMVAKSGIIKKYVGG